MGPPRWPEPVRKCQSCSPVSASYACTMPSRSPWITRPPPVESTLSIGGLLEIVLHFLAPPCGAHRSIAPVMIAPPPGLAPPRTAHQTRPSAARLVSLSFHLS